MGLGISLVWRCCNFDRSCKVTDVSLSPLGFHHDFTTVFDVLMIESGSCKVDQMHADLVAN